ncbi:ATP-binding protein [Brevibacillus porteri]|uniref:ATP-binding protein n=1 Tax=Brevibacillus porteri TaxID=2126350 RepID=UPI003D1A259C
MQSLDNLMTNFTVTKTSDSKEKRKYICEGCGYEVKVYDFTHLFGPNKGQSFEGHNGCKCEDIRLANETLKLHEERKRLVMFNQNSLINPDLQKASFDNYLPTNESTDKALITAKQYASNFEKDKPRNMVFVGPYGLGKSHLAASISKQTISNGYTSIFISVPKLLSKIRSTYNKKSEHTEDELMSALELVDCLILDDIGAEQSKKQDDGESWAVSKLFEIIDGRVGKHTVFTTNLTSKELQDRIGPRSYSRMMQNTEVVKMSGEDYRLKDF